MAQIGVFPVISPMEAANYRRGNLLSPPHPSSCSLHTVNISLFRPHSNPRNASSPLSASISPENHQALLRKRRSVEPNVLQEAAGFLSGMAEMRPLPPIFEINKALATLAKAESYRTVLSHFVKLQLLGVQLNFSTLNIAINCYCHVNQVGFGFSILGVELKHGYEPCVSTFTTLINGLILERKTAEAVELFNTLIRKRVVEPDVIMYGAIVKALCKMGDIATALGLLRSMEERSCKPNTVLYNTIITGLCKDRMVDDAMNFLLEMNGKGICPNVVTYTSLIQGLGNYGKWKEALGILSEMLDTGVSPDVRTFNVLVHALAKQGMTKEAEGLLDVMRERGVDPDVVLYTCLMDGYCMQGQTDEAMRVFDTMLSRGLHPDIYCSNVIKKFMPRIDMEL